MPEQTPALTPAAAAVLLTGLLDDAALTSGSDVPTSEAVAAHRVLRDGSDAWAVGALAVRVSRLGELLDALDSTSSSVPLDIALVADTGLVEAAEARAVLLDDDRVDVVGLHVGLPPDGPLGESAALTLESLDFALPAVVEVPVAAGWPDAIAVIADDGAERVGLRAGDALAAQLIIVAAASARASVTTPVADAAGLLALLAAAAESLGSGVDADRVTAAVSERDPAASMAIVASADPRAVRGRLASVAVADVAAVLDGLRALGLLEEDTAT